jgi:hypothetical protein
MSKIGGAMNKPIETDQDIEMLVKRFEACETAKDGFPHLDHLVLAAWYLQTMSVPAATEQMRTSLFRFLDHYQIDRRKYHETLTVFWVEKVAACLTSLPIGSSLCEKCNEVRQVLRNKDLVLDFYSSEVLWSDAARNSFVTPDKKSWREQPDAGKAE